MRSGTTRWLHAAFQAALVSACRETATENPPPPPPPTVPTTTIAASAPTAAPTASASSDDVTIPNGETRWGQRCAGAIVAGLTPSKPVDALELRLEYFDPHQIVHTGLKGTPCAQAHDQARCMSAFANAKRSDAGEWLVWNRGDEVGAVARKEIGKFLAPIDTPEDAAATLVSWLSEGESRATVLPPCDPSTFRAVPGGYETEFVSRGFCESSSTATYRVSRDGTVDVVKIDHKPPKEPCQRPFLGRKPAGLCARDGAPSRDAEARYFAEAAWFEAASVHAFRALEAELAAHGAPRSLRRRAARARADEVRHARMMRRLANRAGAAERAHARATATRDLEAIATENAVEGCVNETWAALVAHWQAQHAEDGAVRDAMRTIAVDETRHAALAWDVAAWIEPRLSEAARARVRRARDAAIEALHAAGGEIADDPRLARRAGLPSAETASALKRACAPFGAANAG